ncbi:hypothetical protein [Algoriphagus sediminis]|uniref:DUF2154 domain-containing protein n=1 Tax=Algoriphagus sediminis TaxID=3057113 RepID=A0ABT7YF09_9BACT|nr:hypothetical protein [Algoriphagus sediminis]MDN3205116.1 hypothetical protein [Algoriphagus sediminis]
MLKKLCLLILGIVSLETLSQAQIVKEYHVTQRTGFNIVKLDFTSYKSVTHLKRVLDSDPVSIHGHLTETNILPDFSNSINRDVMEVSLVHKNVESDNLGKSITSKLFSGSGNDFDHTWDLGLNSNFLYDLHFLLGMGQSNFDLAMLPITNLKIESASSDVIIFYGEDEPNKIQMDTLLVTLDMGKVDIPQANFTNSKKIIVDVSYGKINLDFGEGMSSSCDVIAALGAGTLNLHLPSESYPIKIKVKTTPMCRMSMPKFLKKIEENVYTTKGYKEDDPRLLELTLDVGVGSIVID